MAELIDFLFRMLLIYVAFGAGVTYRQRKGIVLWHQLKEPPKYSLLVYFLQAIFVWPQVDWVNILYYQRWAERNAQKLEDKDDEVHPPE